jgi:predicted DNA-binding transcriptional regulator
MPLSGSSVNLAGKPAKIGGTLTGAAGAAILFLGTLISLALGLLFGSLLSTGAGLAIGLTMGAFTLALGIGLLFGGRHLWKKGEVTQSQTQEQAIFALASHRGGVLRAREVAQALDIQESIADAELTGLAKRQPDLVTLELDDSGEIYYRFPAIAPPMRVPAPTWEDAAPRARVADPVAAEFEDDELNHEPEKRAVRYARS